MVVSGADYPSLYTMPTTPDDVQSPPFGYLSPPIDINDASSDDGDHLQTPLTEQDEHYQPYSVMHQNQHHFSHSFFHSDVHTQPEVFNEDSSTPSAETSTRSYPLASLLTPSPPEKSAPTHLHSPMDSYLRPFSPPHALDLAHASLDFNPFSSAFPPTFSNHAFSADAEVFTPTKETFDFLSNPFDSPCPKGVRMSDIQMSAGPSQSISTHSADDATPPSDSLSHAHSEETDPSNLESDGVYVDQARTYSPRFPADHTLNPYFVRGYQLGDELGAGGYGFVMTARHRTEGFEVAVKFIIKDKVPDHAWWDDEMLGRVPTEVMVMSLISHDNIVKCLDLFEDDLYFYLVSRASTCFLALCTPCCALKLPY